MKVIVVGLGVQGHKRKNIAGAECVATVDPFNPEADYQNIESVPLNKFDAALCCVPDEPKYELLTYLLKNKKHVLIEKPLFVLNHAQIHELEDLANTNKVVCYTAYNHRFEPHFVRMKEALVENKIGQVYSCRLFYGNGTARLVKQSAWRDAGSGVLHDLGSHLLDTLLFFFGEEVGKKKFSLRSCQRFENKSPDYAAFSSEEGLPRIDCEMSLLSWRNYFTCDIYGEKGSLHISSLCKWGPTTFTFYERVLPSGRPNEASITLAQPDPTWNLEYEFFKKICKDRLKTNLSRDKYILSVLENLKEKSKVEENLHVF